VEKEGARPEREKDERELWRERAVDIEGREGG
jgi:hypothetical protein